LKSFAKFITRVADLAEAEGRALRQSTVAVGLAIALALAASAISVGGLALVAWGIFESFRSVAGFIGAAFISGMFLLACAGGLIWLVIRLGKPR
jgi:hypothetical protein